MSSGERRLRMITYLSPGLPVELFETILQYLEEKTGLEGYLIYESRWSGPPTDREDPFSADYADIGFMCSSAYLQMLKKKNPNIQLCEAAPVHQHPRGENRPIYFSDIIINPEKSEYTHFHDLRGHTFAYNDSMSLSGSHVVLSELRKMGFNSTFFGNTIHSGSHLNSIQLVLQGKADFAAVDSNVLVGYLNRHPEHKTKLSILTSFGPMPIYPAVFNSRLPADLKKKITDCLLEMHKQPEWQAKLTEMGIKYFVPNDQSLYNKENELVDFVKDMKISAAYY